MLGLGLVGAIRVAESHHSTGVSATWRGEPDASSPRQVARTTRDLSQTQVSSVKLIAEIEMNCQP